SPVRARIRSRSNSASPASTVSISRPCDVVVSAHASPSDLKPAFLPVMVARMFNRSRGRSRQPVEPRDHQHVIGLKLVEQPAKPRPVGLSSAYMHVAENLPASGLGQLPRLGVNALALSARRYPCITVFHGVDYAPRFCTKKGQSFQASN